ncbi:type IV secretory pathway VirB10-like protein [Bradyrhizobium diazoefficiens]|uniref:hypothetical protein n=1 Tax=Bradyrhizobium diazoefficiens TaxID=1355477 RepID=UPI0035112319
MTTLSKKNFASLKNVTPARVSQWIAEGKIGRDALVGEGTRARINVELATEQLKGRLDWNQRIANSQATLDEMPAPVAPAPAPAAGGASALDEQFKRERLEGLQRENRKRAEEEAARSGRFVDSQAARAEMTKIASRVVAIIDGALPEIASVLAAKFALPQRDVLHLLRAEFRNVRQRAASSLRASALEVPAFAEAEFDPDRGSEA